MREKAIISATHPFTLSSYLFASESFCRRLPAVSSGENNCCSVTAITVRSDFLFKPCVCLCKTRVDHSEITKSFPLFILIMADKIRRQLQEIALGIEDETINLPVELCEEAIKETRYSLVTKPVNLRKQNLRAMLTTLPRLWGVSEEVNGRILENKKIQFLWNPNQTDEDLKYIPFWVQVRGIPLHFLTTRMVTHIGENLGHFMETDYGGDGSVMVDYVRVRLLWNVDTPLRFQRKFQFGNQSCVLKLRYEKLRNFCSICGMMTHDAADCPQGNNPPPPPDPEDDDEGPDYNPEAQDDDTQKPETKKMEEQGQTEEIPNASKKRKTEASTSNEPVGSIPLVCCEMRQAYAVEDTQQCYNKRCRKEFEVLEIRNWFTLHTMPTEQSSRNAERVTPTNPKPKGEGSLVVRRLKGIKETYSPDLLFLIETKNPDDVVLDVAAQLGYEFVKCVSPVGIGGGLALMWKKTISVCFYDVTPRIIDCKISNKDVSFYFSCVYGHPNRKLRHVLWEKLERISLNRKGPWLMCGDFNEVLHKHEKRGGRPRENWSLVDFRNMVNTCKVSDLPFQGNNMTWAGKQGSHLVECWLDRAMANDQWKATFPASEVTYMEMIESDHRPAIIKIKRTTEQGLRPFQFDTRLCKIPEIEKVIKQSWNQSWGCDNASLYERIKTCRKDISAWKRAHNTNAAVRIKELTHALDVANTSSLTSWDDIQSLKKDLLQAYREEETYWKLKSRNQWLNEGDGNTRFFHATTKNRIARNRLTSIIDGHGSVIYGNKEISGEAIRYFSDLFSSNMPSQTSTALRNIKPMVTEEMNRELTRDITVEEVRSAVFSIGATQAPGPDGFNAAFYQHYLETVGPAIIGEVREFFDKGMMNRDWNHTNLCLIPKNEQPSTMKDFRPISLCNVTYKIVSKILVKRLKGILSMVVSDNQAAFIPGCFITDNVLIAHEILHSLRVRKRCANSYMSVKTYISKAYDRIEWRFLEEVLLKKGFAPKWIQWIMECVRTVSFSVLINGSPYGRFEPTRGLRQGDPLSPSLFILCADVLSSLMSQAVREGSIQAIRVSNRGPAVSHLLFADDSLFFLKADHKNSSNLLRIFKEYGEASGQIINFDKSSITFGSRVYQHTRESIMRILQIPNIGGGGKYLGLPEQFAGKKKEMLQYIHDQLKRRIEGWQTKFLSAAGKETLIKAVAYAMPVYSMNCFQLPMELCSEIDSLIARFWWGSTQEKKKISWIAWKKLVTSKKEGGLGFRDLHLFNQALLANQAWKIIQRPQSLIYRLLKARYFREGTFFTATRALQETRVFVAYENRYLMILQRCRKRYVCARYNRSDTLRSVF
ncbi:Reverse transcriptase domain [Arabidopsis suecica]|uniref:Reverse transcriptase domain n=1 Tax=Arabidopsis suecica TaxID=45249 RepID=A0A8T2CMG8_ARASU|nr:Reverse transcriptase domain [Arabidopsis suecica]